MKKIFLIVTAAVIFSSCDFLEFDESTGKTKDEAYGYFDNVKELVSAAYRMIPSDYGVVGGAMLESATDNSVYTWDYNAVYDIYNDVWSPLNLIDNQWSKYYEVIHDINSFLENYSEENLERFKWDTDYKDNIKQTRNYIYEVRVLRALYYFELIKRYRDVPLLTHTCTLEEVNSLEKTSFEEIIKFISDEIDEVADELPKDHAKFYGETGRVTYGAALAIKARALLYAASPLFNEGNDAQKWKDAAEAAHKVIISGIYYLPDIDVDPLYSPAGGNDVLKSPQLILERRTGAKYDFERKNWPIGFQENSNTGNTPTQNLVDAFEMWDGTPFDWNNPEHVKQMYMDSWGFQSRDPRLYLTVLHNDMMYKGQKIEIHNGGKFGPPTVGATITGYYLNKLMNQSVSLDPVNPVDKNHHFPTYRYAEVLLNYAEAMNEWKGPDYTDSEFTLSAREAINQVRTAATMPEVEADGQDEFREKVRKERRVELAFENHRFWDIRRWKIGHVVRDIYGVKVTKKGADEFTYTKQKVQTRVWDDKMYFYPIPQNEVYVNPNLTQNPGW